MFRKRQIAVMGLGLMLVTAPTEARELSFSMEGRVGGDSNVLRSSRNKASDAFFDLSPQVTLSERDPRLNYDFLYRPTFETFADTENVNGIDHVMTANLGWQPTPRNSIRLNGLHTNRRRLRYETSLDAGSVSGTVVEASDRNRIRRTNGSLSYSYQIAPAWSASLSGRIDDYDAGSNAIGSEPDTRAYSVRVSANHILDSKTTLGINGAGRFRDTRAMGSSAFSSETLIWDVGFFLSRELSETLRFSLQVAPSFISSESIPGRGVLFGRRRTKDSDTSVFVTASVEKEWRKTRVELGYVRSESRSGSGSVSSSISDDVELNFVYQINRPISIRLRGGWNERSQIVRTVGFDDIVTKSWRAIASVNYRINQHIMLMGRYSFRNQHVDGRRNFSGIGDTHVGSISLRYSFDPIAF